MQRVLIVDDEANVRKALTTTLRKAGYDTLEATDGRAALEMAARHHPDVMLVDLRMPEMDGMETLRRMQPLHAASPAIIMMTAYGSAHEVMEAMKLGAFDYVQKPFDLMQVKQVIKKALDSRMPMTQQEEWLETNPDVYAMNHMVGLSAPMQEVYKLVGKVSMSKATVLIQGESGTGKELIAKAIHANSPRCKKTMISVNCGAIPENLLESELFGYERGAFTGANERKLGLFEIADQSTIFLDEVGELSLPLQVKLLRVLQERSITRVGGLEAIPIDVRVIAATNQDLQERIKQNLFREDLFYRLNVVPIQVPPLRERKDDIPMLLHYFIAKFGEETGKKLSYVSKQAIEKLVAYDWPGNVRQLENCIERALVIANGPALLPEHIDLPAERKEEGFRQNDPYKGKTMKEILREVEREVIIRTLQETKGNKLQAANRLEMSRRALLYKIEEYGVQ
ncbi:sigma-54-dependent transcriptional regulator [Brevibacillus migulae]|uniref:sigma-54-dependent transcriptional regulator n=1 Tax=Brevibacillus migulae TaxID=1644114 RepID=UPI00106E1723|nr:sigma-54 dependent transcriptional regulator [Brevibacillus migulae]